MEAYFGAFSIQNRVITFAQHLDHPTRNTSNSDARSIISEKNNINIRSILVGAFHSITAVPFVLQVDAGAIAV